MFKTRLHLGRCDPKSFLRRRGGVKKKKIPGSTDGGWGGGGQFLQITEAHIKIPQPGHFQN